MKHERVNIYLYGNGQFLGYLKSISIANQKIKSTKDKSEAKGYAKYETALKDADAVGMMTHGGIIAEIG